MSRASSILKDLKKTEGFPSIKNFSIKAGKEYFYRMAVVKVLEIVGDHVKIAKVVRGQPTGPKLLIPMAKFLKDISMGSAF